jgi:hypothetical protein
MSAAGNSLAHLKATIYFLPVPPVLSKDEEPLNYVTIISQYNIISGLIMI